MWCYVDNVSIDIKTSRKYVYFFCRYVHVVVLLLCHCVSMFLLLSAFMLPGARRVFFGGWGRSCERKGEIFFQADQTINNIKTDNKRRNRPNEQQKPGKMKTSFCVIEKTITFYFVARFHPWFFLIRYNTLPPPPWGTSIQKGVALSCTSGGHVPLDPLTISQIKGE